MKIPKRLQKFADENNLLVFPVTYKYQGLELKRKGFDICSKETFTAISDGKQYRYIHLKIEPKYYSDRWMVVGYNHGSVLYFKRICKAMFEDIDFVSRIFVRLA
jgi:hypothetical protein